jgi:hypothetical protein
MQLSFFVDLVATVAWVMQIILVILYWTIPSFNPDSALIAFEVIRWGGAACLPGALAAGLLRLHCFTSDWCPLTPCPTPPAIPSVARCCHPSALQAVPLPARLPPAGAAAEQRRVCRASLGGTAGGLGLPCLCRSPASARLAGSPSQHPAACAHAYTCVCVPCPDAMPGSRSMRPLLQAPYLSWLRNQTFVSLTYLVYLILLIVNFFGCLLWVEVHASVHLQCAGVLDAWDARNLVYGACGAPASAARSLLSHPPTC